MLGVRTKTHKMMLFYGIWDRYELYDIANDPDEMNNLLAEFQITTEGGTLDRLITSRAAGGLKTVSPDLQQRLKRLLKETRCAPEPNWKP